MKCQLCHAANATVHVTQIVEDDVTKVDLCETCAREKGILDPSGISLADLLRPLGRGQKPGRTPPETGSEQ